MKGRARLRRMTVDRLSIADERAFRHVALYADLKEILRRDRYLFRLLPKASVRWDRALLLNLTFWGGDGGDVLDGGPVAADVVTHAAWHHLAARALASASGRRPSAESLFLGESIASAFDLYLLGRLLGTAPRSSFLATQVPAMAETASAAGASKAEFQSLLHAIAAAPEQSFAELQALLFDVSLDLAGCTDAEEGLEVLVRHEANRFSPLLHHYELSNWVLFARAQARSGRRRDARARGISLALRASPMPLAWLTERWVTPALRRR
jgi:hypothetical protein